MGIVKGYFPQGNRNLIHKSSIGQPIMILSCSKGKTCMQWLSYISHLLDILRLNNTRNSTQPSVHRPSVINHAMTANNKRCNFRRVASDFLSFFLFFFFLDHPFKVSTRDSKTPISNYFLNNF